MKIAFHSYQLGERGTECCLYDYAKYNRDLLGNESVIVSTSSRPTPSFEKFSKEFEVLLYPHVWKNDRRNNELRSFFEEFCDAHKIDVFYAIKGGENDGIMPTNVKTAAHAVFQTHDPHGTVYAGICEYISKKDGHNVPWVHHILEKKLPDLHEDLRHDLGIPKDALVLGRLGGPDTFSLGFVHSSIKRILEERKDIWFLFLNTNKFIDHPRAIFLPYTMHDKEKVTFVNTCDAMIHARYDGEIFSIAVAEFNIRNKPIITWKPDHIPSHYDTGHLFSLGEKGIYYRDEKEVYDIFRDLSKKDIVDKDWDAYKDKFSAENVMLKEFKPIFLT